MANVRRFLRYDVKLPIYVELSDEQGRPLGWDEQTFWPETDRYHLEGINEMLKSALDELGKSNGQLMYMLHQFDMRLNFLAWLLAHLVENQDPRDDSGFDFRVREDSKIEPPELPTKANKIGALLHAMFMHIDLTIKEVIAVVRRSHDRLFVFPLNSVEPFDHNQYVRNLEKVAEQGSAVAQVLLLLEDKLNVLLKVLARLKSFYRLRAAVDDWPVEVVNLSAGGVGLWRSASLPMFQPVNVFLNLHDGVFVAHGKVVFCRQLGKADKSWRIGIDFEWLPAEEQQRVTLFVQWHELTDTMRQFPRFPGMK